MVTGMRRPPVVLVHGWNSHPGIWNRFVPRLEQASLPYWRFDHSAMDGEGLAGQAVALGTYVEEMRGRTGYDGAIDVVCHSIGPASRGSSSRWPKERPGGRTSDS